MVYLSFLLLAQAPAASPQPGNPLAGMFVPFACIGVIFYFLVIRPQNQKQKQHNALLKSLKTGDKIITTGGVHGLVSNVKETTVIVKVADNVKLEIEKSAVTSVAKRAEAQQPAVAA